MKGLIKIRGVEYCPDERNCGCGYPDISTLVLDKPVQMVKGNAWIPQRFWETAYAKTFYDIIDLFKKDYYIKKEDT